MISFYWMHSVTMDHDRCWYRNAFEGLRWCFFFQSINHKWHRSERFWHQIKTNTFMKGIKHEAHTSLSTHCSILNVQSPCILFRTLRISSEFRLNKSCSSECSWEWSWFPRMSKAIFKPLISVCIFHNDAVCYLWLVDEKLANSENLWLK